MDRPSRSTPPYVTFRSFTELLGSLLLEGVPANITEHGPFRSKNSVLRSKLLTALRFFDLVAASGRVNPSLDDLCAAFEKHDRWTQRIEDVLLPRYADIVGNVNLDSTTYQKLEKAFAKNTSLTGSSIEKAIRFYLRLLDEANLTYSSHLVAWKRSTTGKSKPGPKSSDRPPAKFFVSLQSGGRALIRVPSSIVPEDIPQLRAAVAGIAAYVSDLKEKSH